MAKPKIAFIIPSLSSGGAERVLSILANSLLEKYDIVIITIANSKVFYNIDSRVKIIHSRKELKQSKSVLSAISNNFALYKGLKAKLKKENADLAIAFTTTANILASIAAKSLNIPSIVSERSNPMTRQVSFFWGFMRKIAYKKSDYLIVQTENVKSFYNSYISKDKLVILKNPISKELARNKDINLKKDNIILNVGRLHKNKAQDLLIRAFSNLNNDDWKLVFVGSGDQKENYEALVSSLNLKSKVSFVEPSSSVYKHYNAAKIFAFCSQSEGFPNVLIEAMHYELACISSDCNFGPSELIKNGENGFLFPVNNQVELEQKLQLLIDDESLQRSFSKNALKAVIPFQEDKVIKEWDNLIEKTLSN